MATTNSSYQNFNECVLCLDLAKHRTVYDCHSQHTNYVILFRITNVKAQIENPYKIKGHNVRSIFTLIIVNNYSSSYMYIISWFDPIIRNVCGNPII